MFLKRIVSAFEIHHVHYAVVGGYAVALHGAVRGTVDVDVAIKLSLADFKNAEKALRSIGLEPRLPVRAEDVFNFREEYIKNRNLIAWSFHNPKNASEIVDIVITHDSSKMKLKKINFDSLEIKVASKEDLIKMKKASGRPQDLEDIKALEKLK